MPKFSDPTLSDAISGDVDTAARRRSSRVIPRPLPVDTFITASQAPAIFAMSSWNSSGRGSGRPVSGSRACRWTIAAPASTASIDAPAISSGVTGRCGDIVGVWIPPVGAQVMMTGLDIVRRHLPRDGTVLAHDR